MANDKNKNLIQVHFYAEVPVSNEFYEALQEEDIDYNLFIKLAKKYGWILMTEPEAETAPEGTPLVVAVDDEENDLQFFEA